MNKKLIRLTESDLHRIVKESVIKILRETHNEWDELADIRWRNRDYRNNSDEAQKVGKVRGDALANWHKWVKDSESKVQEEGYDDEYNPHPDDNWHGYGNLTRERWDADEIPYQYKQVHESMNEIFNTPKGQAIAAHVFRRAKDRGLDAWEKDEPTEKYDDVAHQAFNTAKQHWDNPRNKEAFRFGDEQRKLGNSPQKTLYNLKKRHQSMDESTVNEVMYNGRSYHGSNNNDWRDLADEREDRMFRRDPRMGTKVSDMDSGQLLKHAKNGLDFSKIKSLDDRIDSKGNVHNDMNNMTPEEWQQWTKDASACDRNCGNYHATRNDYTPNEKEKYSQKAYERARNWNNYRNRGFNAALQQWNENTIKRAVEESVNEVMFNGQSLHGNNPKDWLAVNKNRKSIADKYYKDEMNNLASIRNYAHKQFNEPEENLPFPNNSIEGLPNSKKNNRAMSRNMDNAISLLQKGVNIDQ